MVHEIFERWGIDAIGPLPRTVRGKCYILTAVDFLSKWSEAKAVRSVDKKEWLILFMKSFVVDLVYL